MRYGFFERSIICLNKKKSERLVLASAEDGVAINGSPKPRSSSNLGDMRTNFTGSLQDENSSNGLIQSLHDAARSIELAVREKITPSRFSWFPATWLGADKYAWVKTLSYQVRLCLLVALSLIHDGVYISLMNPLFPLANKVFFFCQCFVSSSLSSSYIHDFTGFSVFLTTSNK